MSDAIPGTTERCEAQPSELAPPISVPARSAGTTYYLHLRLDDTFMPGSSQIFNNHIPLDLDLGEALAISKTTPMKNVMRGQLVPYTITLRNLSGLQLRDVRAVDYYPAGFRYVPGSARIDNVPTEPVQSGRQLTWSGVAFGTTDEHVITLLLAVGAGVGEGEFVNRARVWNGLTDRPLSGEATATVRVVPDPTFDCTDIIGKVFDDANRNGHQDEGEGGLGGVRLVSARGLAATTDKRRPLPPDLCGGAQRRPRQQLRAEAGRPHPAQRLPALHPADGDRARHARQGAEHRLRCFGLPRGEPRPQRRGVRARRHRTASVTGSRACRR